MSKRSSLVIAALAFMAGNGAVWAQFPGPGVDSFPSKSAFSVTVTCPGPVNRTCSGLVVDPTTTVGRSVDLTEGTEGAAAVPATPCAAPGCPAGSWTACSPTASDADIRCYSPRAGPGHEVH